MKKINIELSEKSIQNAIQELKRLESTIKKVNKDFLKYVCEWIINKANKYIQLSDLGSIVKETIIRAWSYKISNNGAKIINNAIASRRIGGKIETVPLAVLVEFGVGIEGFLNPHPLAELEGYEYDVPSTGKRADGSWGFYTNEEELDIPKSELLSQHTFDSDHKRGQGGKSGYRLYVKTMGTEGVMYAYNAIVDAKASLINGELAKKWNEILERYIG